MSIGDIPVVPAAYLERRDHRLASEHAELWEILDEVKDPEIPALSLWDLGVLSNVELDGDTVRVTITPTYSGCPAMEAMEADSIEALKKAGYDKVEVSTKLFPAWTTDWLSPEGRVKLQEYGIAPPEGGSCCDAGPTPESGLTCPHCQSTNTVRVSEFGSTACKALFQCSDCHEPFDYFKNI